MIKRLVIIGVGLLGGSIGLTAKKKNVAEKVIGVGRNPKRLELARQKGAIDEFTTELATGLRDGEFIILCLPVERIIEFLPQVAEHSPASAIVTDVGSTKKTIVEEAEKLFGDGRATFIGSHPLAGSEKSGVEFSTSTLFKDATCFVTVNEMTPLDKLQQVVKFWRSLGARPFILRPDRHDYLVSMSSQGIHFAASALAKAFGSLGEDANLLRLIIGTGFKDTTRIAKGDEELWLEICRQNVQYIAEALDKFTNELSEIKEAIKNRDFDRVKTFLADARNLRQMLD
ncbi:prephenate dehydrogenase [Candidatus Sumerlaeota bacterium]|nr:prephenate dehydrogenase [Candidatus Sumerlaeota bacterium]